MLAQYRPPRLPHRPVILIVEDYQPIRTAYARLFTLKGWVALQAETLAEGLRVVGKPPLPIEAVVLDLMLPDGSGERLLIEARAIGFTGRIIVHSGSSHGDSAKARLMAIGADAVVPKPCGFEEIWAAVVGSESLK